jgi:hypothetical protein
MKKLGFLPMLALGILLAGVVLVVENLEFKQETRTRAQQEGQLYYQTDFTNLDGWEVRERDGKVEASDSWVHLSATNAPRYPVIARWNEFGGSSDKFIPATGDFRIEIKFKYKKPQNVAGYGVSSWGSAWCENAGFANNFKEFFGFTWHKTEGLQLTLFGKTKKLAADINEHVWEVSKTGTNWEVKLDNQSQLTGTDSNSTKCPYPDSLRFGDPTKQTAGIWPELFIDYVKVFTVGVTPSPSPTPSGLPTPTPSGTPTPTPSGSATPSPSPSGATLNFKARFTGLTEDKRSLKVTLTAKNTSWTQEAVTQSNGTYSGISLVGLTVGQTYDFVLSAHPYLIAKKSLTITTGVNPSSGFLDFGELKTGDLNKDNEINGLDWSLMKMSFGRSGE